MRRWPEPYRKSFTADNTGVVCVTTGAAIRTPQGDVRIDELRVGDLVCTFDNGSQPIRWIGKTQLRAAELTANLHKHPIFIQRSILELERDLLVPPQHGMMIGKDYLASATHLLKKMRGVPSANGKKQVTYAHMMFHAHQIIFAENTPSESFYLGPIALKMTDAMAREAVFDMFPDLTCPPNKETVSAIYGPTARAFIRKRDLLSELWLGASRQAKCAKAATAMILASMNSASRTGGRELDLIKFKPFQ